MKDKKKWALAAVLTAVMLAAGPGVRMRAGAETATETGVPAEDVLMEGMVQEQEKAGMEEKLMPQAVRAGEESGLENQADTAAEAQPVQQEAERPESGQAEAGTVQENREIQEDISYIDSQTNSSGGGISQTNGGREAA